MGAGSGPSVGALVGVADGETGISTPHKNEPAATVTDPDPAALAASASGVIASFTKMNAKLSRNARPSNSLDPRHLM